MVGRGAPGDAGTGTRRAEPREAAGSLLVLLRRAWRLRACLQFAEEEMSQQGVASAPRGLTTLSSPEWPLAFLLVKTIAVTEASREQAGCPLGLLDARPRNARPCCQCLPESATCL